MLNRYTLVLTAAMIGLSTQAGGTQDIENRTDYAITLSGLPLARAHFQTRRSSDSYKIDAQIESTGLGHIIADTKAEMTSSGAVRNGAFRPDKFFFRYKYGKRNRLFDTRFENGNVVSSIIEPKRKPRKDWIDIQPQDLRAVTDPVAGLIIAGDKDPCGASIAVYDGEARLTLALAPKRQETYKTEGFSGPAVVCSLRYQPKAGYRRGHKDIQYVSKLKNMEIWFAKAGPMNVYAPVYLTVPTSYGPLTIKATHFDG